MRSHFPGLRSNDILFLVLSKKLFILFIITVVMLIHLKAYSAPYNYVPGELIIKIKSNAKDNIHKLSSGEIRIGSYSKFKEIKDKYKLIKIENLFKEQGTITKQSIKKQMEKRKLRAPKSSKKINLSLFYHMKFPETVDIKKVISELNSMPEIEFAEPNYYYHLYSVPNDPYFSYVNNLETGYYDQWGLYRVDIMKSWDTIQLKSTPIVAVIDTGIDYTHQDLENVVWVNTDETAGNNVDDDGNGFKDDVYGYDFGNSDGDPYDVDGHGTHVAGVIAAETNNNVGISAAGIHCKIMMLKVFADGGYNTTLQVLSNAVNYAINNGADIINFSLGGTYSQTFTQTVENAVNNGLVVVAAAGNGDANGNDFIGDNLDIYKVSPVCNDGTSTQNYVIGVSAIDRSDVIAEFSNYGSYIDITAPGFDILSARGTGTNMNNDVSTIYKKDLKYIRASGTSQACPLVSGIIANMLSSNPALTYDQIKNILFTTAIDLGTAGRDTNYGYGLINAFRAVGMCDVAPPTINHTALVQGDIATSISVNAFIIDNVNSTSTGNIIPSANLFYLSYIGSVPQGSYASVQMEKNGTNYTGYIPPQGQTITDVRYYIEAYDANPNNTVKLPSNAPVSYYNIVLQDLSGPRIISSIKDGDYISSTGNFTVNVNDNVSVSENTIAFGIIKSGITTTYNIVNNSNIVTYINGQASINLGLLNLDPGSYSIRLYCEDTSNNSSVTQFNVNLSNVSTTLSIIGPEGSGSSPLNYPNPFNPLTGSTRIAFQITKAVDSVEVNIYSISGDLIRSLIGATQPGYQTVEWNGRDESNNIVPNGIYLYRIIVTSGSETILGKGKIAVLK